MNEVQICLFFLYSFCILCGGLGVYTFINPKREAFLNNYILLGESLLLGSIVTIGMMVLFGVLHLYHPLNLWGLVLLNLGALVSKEVRVSLASLFRMQGISITSLAFWALMLLFFIRNVFFVVDVDSHSTYLFAQKLWLAHGTNVFATLGLDDRIYAAHFDCVPYALTIDFFGNDTIFPLLINFLWRAISLVLIFGYIRYRFNGLYALSGMMLVLFNDHFFMSSANKAVLINGALIAFVFATAYNFWEARQAKNFTRFFLALLFLSYFVANKLMYLPVSLVCLSMGIFIQPKPMVHIKSILTSKKHLLLLGVGVFFSALWYIKNYLATGLATYPVFAWKFGILGWTLEKGMAIQQYLRGVNFFTFCKYATYFFIWPGIETAKITCLSILFLPLLFMALCIRKKFDQEEFLEICFWLGLAFLILLTSCMGSHQDPRYYRYPIDVFTFASILVLHTLVTNLFGLPRNVLGIVLLLFAAKGYGIILPQGGTLFNRPSLSENIQVLTNKLHFNDVMARYYPLNILANEGFQKNIEKTKEAAWDSNESLSAFLLPLPMRPQLNLWYTNVIRWSSYDKKEDILADLKNNNIRWVIRVEDSFKMIPVEDYAKEAVKYNRYPSTICYPYTMPEELIQTHYKK